MRVFGFTFLLVLVLVGLSSAQETSFSTGPQYLMTSGSPLFARPIATPSLSLGEQTVQPPAREDVSIANDETLASVLDLQRQMALPAIYYGTPRITVVEISFAESSSPYLSSRPLPASIMESGVVESTDAQALRLRGYGGTLPEAAGYWKKHKVSASHTYTNADVEKLRIGSHQ
jgi:hypothetical protein